MNKKKWEKISSKIVYRSKWLKVRRDQVITPGGSKGTYDVVEKDPDILIIPFVGSKICMVRQYRYPVSTASWEFPQGTSGKSEKALDVARRELKEETGLTSNKFVKIGTSFLAPGHHTQECIHFLAVDCKIGESSHEKTEEDMVMQLFSLAEIRNMVKKGLIKDNPTLSALTFYMNYIGK